MTIFSFGDINDYGYVNNNFIDRACKLFEIVYLTECGDNIRSENDAISKGVIAADGEYPDQLEESEAEDPNIEIIVAPDGKSFYLQGKHYIRH